MTSKSENVSSTISAVIEKDEGGKLGISLGKKGSKIVITGMSEGLPASKTLLRVNMEVLTVNNVTMTSSTSTEEVLALLKTSEAVVTILAQQPTLKPGTLITAVVTKSDPTESVGIGLGVDGSGTGITSIKVDSLACNTDLQTGMILKSVDNKDCTYKSPAEVANLLANAKGTFPILAQVKEDIPVVQATPTSGAAAGKGGRGAPAGLPEGGTWSKRTYIGNQTMIAFVIGCFCFGIFGPLALCCPCDERDVYTVNGKVYATDGQFLGSAGTAHR